jgi:hypothetical protein
VKVARAAKLRGGVRRRTCIARRDAGVTVRPVSGLSSERVWTLAGVTFPRSLCFAVAELPDQEAGVS